jgi:glycosyltransferase involved in cell wall biosynthesis
MSRPLVSVIIPTTRPDQLEAALDSVEGQEPQGPLECVVAPDGISVPTLKPRPFPVRVAPSPRPTGPAAARNRAARAAQGLLLAFLDDDDRWCPQHLAQVLPGLDQTPAIAFTDAWVRHIDEGWAARLQVPFSPRLLRWTNPVILSTVAVPRSLFWRLGGFDASFRRYEDWDWLLRAQQAGVLFLAHPDPTVVYRFSSRSTSADSAGMRRDLDRLVARHHLGPLPVTNFARMAQEGLPSPPDHPPTKV